MPRTLDWGEPKENHSYRITETAWNGIAEMAKSLGKTPTEVIEYLGRGCIHPVTASSIEGVLTTTIMLLQNERDNVNKDTDKE